MDLSVMCSAFDWLLMSALILMQQLFISIFIFQFLIISVCSLICELSIYQKSTKCC